MYRERATGNSGANWVVGWERNEITALVNCTPGSTNVIACWKTVKVGRAT